VTKGNKVRVNRFGIKKELGSGREALENISEKIKRLVEQFTKKRCRGPHLLVRNNEKEKRDWRRKKKRSDTWAQMEQGEGKDRRCGVGNSA